MAIHTYLFSFQLVSLLHVIVKSQNTTAASFFYPSWPCRILPQLSQFAPRLPDLFSNCSADGMPRHYGAPPLPLANGRCAHVPGCLMLSPVEPRHPQALSCWWFSYSHSLPAPTLMVPPLPPLRWNVGFKCFRCLSSMLQMSHLNATKVDRDVVYVSIVSEACCKGLLKIFYQFSVLYYSKVFMLQVASVYLNVAYVSHIYCMCMF
jgi:hypothetical protein